ncbi:MAG: SUMF1/EgtB/PvdO family nonheme iron enzyme [Alphaproteobacteria bacterium]|nr:SUMF1/EgtB/PvdO family nonheme iron enzyme [Alphaproteobacteria bacterium]
MTLYDALCALIPDQMEGLVFLVEQEGLAVPRGLNDNVTRLAQTLIRLSQQRTDHPQLLLDGLVQVGGALPTRGPEALNPIAQSLVPLLERFYRTPSARVGLVQRVEIEDDAVRRAVLKDPRHLLVHQREDRALLVLLRRILEDLGALDEPAPELHAAERQLSAAVGEDTGPVRAALQAILDNHKRLMQFQRWVPAGRTLQEVMVEVKATGWGSGEGPRGCNTIDGPLRHGPLGEQTLEQVLDQPELGQRWALLGHPGAGKTTVLRRLAIDRAAASLEKLDTDGVVVLPLFVSLASWSRSGQGLVRHLAADLSGEDVEPEALVGPLQQALDEGRALLLLDGLDEVDPERVLDTARRVSGLAERWPQVPIVLTSRPQGFTPLPAPFTGPSGEDGKPGPEPFGHLELQPLSLTAREQLVANWLEPAAAAGLLRRIQKDHALREMAGVPLLLTMLCLVERERPEASEERPGLRTEVYKEVLRLLMRGKPTGDPTKHQRLPNRDLALGALERLSLGLVERGGVEWRRETLSEMLMADEALWTKLRQGYGGVDHFLEAVEEVTGLLFAVDPERERFRFLHRSLLEYLAARALRQQGERWKALAGELNDPAALGRWAEVFALLAGMLDRRKARRLLELLIDLNQPLGLRALATCDAVEGEDVVELLAKGRPAEWTGWNRENEQALRERREAIEGLWELVGDPVRTVRLLERFIEGAPPVDLAFAWLALEGRREPEAVALRERERFFGLAGRPVQEVGVSWVEVPGGRFQMGSTPEERERLVPQEALKRFQQLYDSESPRHRVEVTAFRLSARPVTVGEYERFAPEHRARREWRLPDIERHPVVNVCWYEAMIYAVWAGARLPTEAEWEYGARAGSTTAFWWGDDVEGLDAHTWHDGNSGGNTHAVGAEGHANGWGMSDMLGNVWEWTQDGQRRYTAEAVSDPVGPGGSSARGVRGGSFDNEPWNLRSALRLRRSPGRRFRGLGFRCARSGPD